MTEIMCPPLTREEIERNMNREFDAWFARLQALTECELVAEKWTERWFDGFTPEAALAEGPEDE